VHLVGFTIEILQLVDIGCLCVSCSRKNSDYLHAEMKALLFIIEAPCVLCEKRTESLYIKPLIFVFIAVCDAMWSSYAGRAVMTL